MGARTYVAHGYAMRFTWTRDRFEEIVEFLVLPGWRVVQSEQADVHFRIEGQDNCVNLFRGDETIVKGLSFESARLTLRGSCHLNLASYNTEVVFVHAGVVLSDSGLIVFPGPTFAGKTSLVKALVELGCSYFSDEYAVIDKNGLVQPFPRTMTTRSEKPGKYHFSSPESLGWSPSLKSREPALFCLTEFQEGVDWKPVQLSHGQGLIKALANAVAARVSPELVLKHLKAAITRSVVIEGPRGEASVMAPRLLSWLKELS